MQREREIQAHVKTRAAHQASKAKSNPPPRTNPAHTALQERNTMSVNQGNTSGAQPTSQASQGQPSGYEQSEGRARRAGRRKGTAGQGEGRRRERSQTPPPASTHPTASHRGHSRAPTRPATEPYGPAREGVCPRACATAHPGKECVPQAGQAGHTRSTTHQHAPRHTARQHHDKRPRPKTSKPPRTSPAVPTAQQPSSGWTREHPAANPAPAGYDTAAVRMEVCAPGSEPSPSRLRHS